MLKIGTDFSGIEAVMFALRNLKVPHEHVWSCEVDKHCIKNITANCAPNVIFTDITTRNIADVPDCHLYVAGFPCQPFSTLRKINLQNQNVDTRRDMVRFCYEIIETKLPVCFILENIPQLITTEGGSKFKGVIERLNRSEMYKIHSTVLNTKDFDIPQNRRRVFMVGIRKDMLMNEFTFPKPIKQTRVLEDFLQDKTMYPFRPQFLATRLVDRLPVDHMEKVYAVKYRAGDGISVNASPCITTSTDIYITRYNRNLTPREKLLLQGFPNTFINACSESQLSKQAGNAMSVNVLENILEQVFKALSPDTDAVE